MRLDDIAPEPRAPIRTSPPANPPIDRAELDRRLAALALALG